MSLKLPMLMVAATVSAGLFVTQSDQTAIPLAWLSKDLHEGATGSDREVATGEGFDLPASEGIARHIRALRQTPPKAQRLAQAATIVPFQMSQLEQESAPPSANPAQAATERPPAQVDETALRYFAMQGDTARLAAEIARLRQLYPDWTPPADPLAIPTNADQPLEEMWQLYAQGHYGQVRKAIIERQAANPQWEPPADLLDRLAIAEARSRLVNASELKQYQTVIDVGAANPPLLNCSEVDVLWRVAEAFANTDRPQRAVDAYSYILTNCNDPAERLATIQKAAAVLPYDRVQPLFALEKPGESGAREFDTIRDDLARRFVAQANEEPSLKIEPEYVDRLKASARADGPASDALLLGWYHLRRDNADEATAWFGRARERQDSADASQGLALSLLEQGKPAEAEAVLYTWRDTSKEAVATYLATTANYLALDPPVKIEEDRLTRMAQTVIGQRYAPSAQQFGWYARAFDQAQTAAEWFELALEWAPDDEASAYGLALTRLQLNDKTGFADLQEKWAKQSARIADLAATPTGVGEARSSSATTSVQQAAQREELSDRVATQAPPRFVRAGERAGRLPAASVSASVAIRQAPSSSCASRIDPTRLSAGAALQRGWCLMELNRPLEAADSFQAALSSGNRRISEEAAYGQSLAYLRLGLTDRAAVSATRAPMRPDRARELQASILADRAIHAFQSDRYRETLLYLDQRAQVQQETVDLMVLRAYSYMNLNRPHEALQLFQAAAATGNRDASRGLADAKAAIGLR